MRLAGWSVAAHGALLALLLGARPAVRVRTLLPGTAQGARVELSYLPSPTAASTAKAERKEAPSKAPKPRLRLPASLVAPPAQASSAAPSASSNNTLGNDALGNEDIRIALTTYSPSPKPDLSRLPRGAQGEVVLDITIDPTGQVADLQILQKLGFGVDDDVADTVRTWKFSPATQDGVPVASVQELHFHYGPA